MMRYLLAATGETIQENPSIAAATCIFLVAFTLVAANALYAQNGGHPVPLWATRDNITTQSVSDQSPLRPANTIATTALTLERVPIPIMRPDNNDPQAPASSLVREAQSHLAALGYYRGAIDGLYGPKTQDAIISFESDYGFARTGLVSTALLKNIGDMAQNTGKSLSPGEDPIDAGMATAISGVELKIRKADPGAPDASAIARVQIGLINFGEVEISVDGVLGQETVSAIQRFQERYRLPVTGRPDDAILRKLEDIGALRKS